MSNIIVQPSSGILEFSTGTAGGSTLDSTISGSSRITFNSGELVVTSYMTGNLNRFSVDGSQGRVFSVDDNLSGSLLSVNTIAGLPVLEAFSDGTIVMGTFGSGDLVVTGNQVGIGTGNPNYKLDVNGAGNFTSLYVNGTPVGGGSVNTGELYARYVNLVSGQTIGGAKDFSNTARFTGAAHVNTLYTNSAYVGNRPVLTGLIEGSNVTLVNNNNGTYTISATTGGGGGGTTGENIVYTSGDQNISGEKTFYDIIRTNYSDFTIGSGVGAGTTDSIYIGTLAGASSVYANASVFMGWHAGYNCDITQWAVAIGLSAAENTSGSNGYTAIGYSAGNEVDNSVNFTALGYLAGSYLLLSDYAIAIGTQAGASASGFYYGVAIGTNAGFGTNNSTEGIFIGNSAGYFIDDSNYTTCIGNFAGFDSSSATYSTFIGYRAGYQAHYTTNGVAIGYFAGASATGQDKTIFIGDSAGGSSKNIDNSVCLGEQAGNNAVNATHMFAIGTYAGSASYNVEDSIFIGNTVGYALTNATGCIYLGGYSGDSRNYTLRIGSPNYTGSAEPLIYGEFDTSKVEVYGSVRAVGGYRSSDNTSGIDASIAYAKSGGGNGLMVFKNGLLVSYT